MGVVDTSPLRPAKGQRRGAQTSQRARPNRPEWAQAQGLVERPHLLDVPDREQVPVRVHGIAEAS
jgi:hypothetical protein